MVDATARTEGVTPTARFIFFSIVGVLGFFTPVPTAEGTTIPIDYATTWMVETFPTAMHFYAVLAIVVGAIYPFVSKTWNENAFELVFTVLKIIAIPVALLVLTESGPAWLMRGDIGPFLFYDLVVPIGIMIPLGGLLLAFLIGYGLLEFMGVLTHNIMRPVWHLPGRASITALASYAASLVVGLLITNREYNAGRYTLRESVILATGFATVSAPFLVIVASVLDITHIFFTYFIVAFFVTIAVTAISVRLWPLRSFGKDGEGAATAKGQADPSVGTEPEAEITGGYLRTAVAQAREKAKDAPGLLPALWENLRDALVLTANVLPAILAVGLVGLVLVEYTPIFDYLAYPFYPLMLLLQLPDPWLAAVATPIGITEMLLPALVVVDAHIVTRFVVGVFCVSQIIFFSTSIPAILATDFPIGVPRLLGIWLVRTVLTFVITTPIAFLLL